MSGTLIPRSEVRALGDRLRRDGRSVVFANGCFDILHVGHVRYLEEAKRCGDVLVVGVNSDRAVAALKGEGRPIIRENGRAEMVAAIESVDYVVVFDELTAADILLDLLPHVHCKGTDYTMDSVPERDVVKGFGGEVRIVGDAKTHSTRDLLAEIARRAQGE